MKSKKQARICGAAILSDGAVRLTFTRPHNVLKAGQVVKLSNGPHTVLRVLNKHTFEARRWRWYDEYLVRAKVIFRMLWPKREGAAR